jgi:7-cyano-7-deazaguanine synthase
VTAAKPKAVVLLSGGLDSTTTLATAKSEGFDVYALTFRYGQRHSIELEAARRIARHFEVAGFLEIELDLRRIGGSALTDDIDVPKNRPLGDITNHIPVTYVPARNTIFLSFALAWAEKLNANHIFIGVNSLDYSGYPDCRPEYIEAYQRMANLATKAGIESRQSISIHTPLIHMSKAEIIQMGMKLGVDYSMTTSCYDPTSDGSACGHCDSCLLRLKGFRELGVQDPRAYQREDRVVR